MAEEGKIEGKNFVIRDKRTFTADGEVKPEVEVQEKVNVVKETEVVYREIKQADGTVIKETVTKDTAKKETDKSSKVVNEKAKNDISVLVSYDFSEKKEIYGIHYQRRLGDTPFKAGIFGVSTGVLGLSIGIEL